MQGKITLIQNAAPALEDGAYELKVTQRLEAGEALSESFETSARFAVRGERFSLAPGELHSVFPADHAVGDYGKVLPHAVLSRSSLPWERSPAGADAHGNRRTWLAVLLFDDGDLHEHPGFDPEPRPATVADLFKSSLVPESSLGTNLSYFDAAHSVDAALDWGEQLADPCMVLDVPLELFRAVAPAPDDLFVLAHTREVTMEGQERGSRAKVSVVVGNRLAAPAHKSRIYLVSLEGLAGRVEAGRSGFVRLAVLKSWSYAALDTEAAGGSFSKILGAVDPGPLRKPLREPEADADVTRALELGYTAFDHEMRGGSTTVSWYRGPLLPYVKRGRFLKLPLTSADRGTRYDPELGMLDVSYSAAWQLGRLLALQDKAYSIALYGWKRELERRLVAQAEAAAHDRALASVLPEAMPSADLVEAVLGALKTQAALGGKP